MAILRKFISSNLFIFFLVIATTNGQAPAPTPSGSTNITAVLEKAGQFTMFIRLLKSTQAADQINTQLNSSSSQGLTVFAPTDNAFSSLKSGTLNSLSDQQKVQLVQFHVLPTLLTMPQFQTVSNPLRTQAGDGQNGEFPLNITSSGNQVNITTGVVSATVANSVYSDKQLAVYQVDQVLLPLAMFGSSSAAPAPAPEKGGSVTTGSASGSDGGGDTSTDSSDAERIRYGIIATVAAIAASSLWI
ncbi:Fasciclin-like arabinogalactan protein 11 [Raphanus sativus]|uniref:Fasciclin-like arabinogalactan protein 11 n=1 Tax=Raphanus sativus TaxID=3726 RepID=A0A6J0MMS7_RAPSA|nr:fasciclin-like arabinogalactan protein 11 [Raphanus sativus]KAJ4908877.1 Fasciclin-like arabinogalactan protein 11 [Raphanus sativus]